MAAGQDVFSTMLEQLAVARNIMTVEVLSKLPYDMMNATVDANIVVSKIENIRSLIGQRLAGGGDSDGNNGVDIGGDGDSSGSGDGDSGGDGTDVFKL